MSIWPQWVRQSLIGGFMVFVVVMVILIYRTQPSNAGFGKISNWNPSTTYPKGGFVSYEGSTYISAQTHMGHLPTDTRYWTLLAAKGDRGSPGSTGSTGSTGSPGSTGATGANGADATDYTYTEVSINTILTSAHSVVGVDTSGGSEVTITLPAASAGVQTYTIADVGGSAGTYNIVIAADGTDTIGGASSFTINAAYNSIIIYSDGTDAWLLA